VSESNTAKSRAEKLVQEMAKSRYRNKQKQNFKKNMTGLVKCFSPGARLKLSNQWRAIMSMGRE